MEKLLLLLAVFSGSYARPQDLSKSVFTFPLDIGTSHVKLITTIQDPITEMTVCLRFHSVLTRGQSLFSLATPAQSNDVLLFKLSPGVYRMYVNGVFLDVNMPDNAMEWNSVCWTWGSRTGLTVLWVNGKRSARSLLKPGASIIGIPSIILGQEQDSYGGGFNRLESFVGDITDVHFWDSVISPCQIRFYMEGSTFVPGNILNWTAMEYNITGSVFVEKSDFDRLSCY